MEGIFIRFSKNSLKMTGLLTEKVEEKEEEEEEEEEAVSMNRKQISKASAITYSLKI
jgi:hypothetical protein